MIENPSFNNTLKQRKWYLWLIIFFVVGVIILLIGVGYWWLSGHESSMQDDAVVNPVAVPVSAKPEGLILGGKMTNVEMIERLTVALEKDSDVIALVSRYKALGFDWGPRATDFVAETDFDGTPLVGITHRRTDSSLKRTGWFVALYPLNTEAFSRPKYIYFVTYDSSASSPLTRYWPESGNIRSFEEMPEGQEFFSAPE